MKQINIRSLLRSSCTSLFFFLVLLFSAIPGTSISQTTNGNYESEIKSADDFYTAKDYGNALMLYRSASIMKPAQKYPQERIDLISKLLNENISLKNSLFEDAILKGENYYTNKDYPTANNEFRKALEIDPAAQYPKDKLALIRQVYTDPNDAARYSDAMVKANQAMAAGDYDMAKNWYQVALTSNPDARQPRDKMVEADKLKAESIARKAQYDKIIAGADKLLQSEKRQEARAEYKKALDLLPNQTYAIQRLAEIDLWLNDRKKEQDAYDLAISQADQFYINRDFANARVKYQEALKVKPAARYPKDMLDKTSSGESEVKSLQQRYDAAIASADNFFKAGDMDAALLGYKSASGILPGEAYPRTRIAEIEKNIGEKASRKEAYDIAIMNGNQALEQNKPEAALAHFKNALSLLPDEKYPSEKIAEINTLLADRKKADENYRAAIAAADLKFKEKKYEEASTGYRSALAIKPDEKYPQDKLNEIAEIYKTLRSKEDGYNNAILAGDRSFFEKDYNNALTSYKDASDIKPAEKYPQDKIAEINRIFQEQKKLDNNYNSTLAAADKSLAAMKYNDALTGYRKALEIKPSEKYPQEKIDKINGILAGLQARDEKYSATIANADRLFGELKYPEAIGVYREALAIKPAEKYPQDKISEAEIIIAKNKAMQSNYESAIADADKLFGGKKYTEALAGYKNASTLKPAEQYPVDKIAEINGILVDLAAKQAAYDAAVARGDKMFAAKNYDESISSYKQALVQKPDELYPTTRIAEINTILNGIKATDEAYTKAIADADASLTQKQYSEALAGYKSALEIKSGEKYPQDKITEINAALAAIKATNDSYDKTVADADKLFDGKKYSESIVGYNQALGIKPGEKYPVDRITEAQKIIADLKAQQESYAKAIAEGDKQFSAKAYTEALSAYNNAKTILPDEKYPVQKIAEINTILNGIKAIDDQFNTAIANADGFFGQKKYREALEPYESASTIKPAETYPKQQIEKINQLLAEQKKLDDDYAKLVAGADKAFTEKQYQPALSSYRGALELKPSEQYPKDKINTINGLLSEILARNEAYTKAIADADASLVKKQYSEALAGYKSALEIKPGEKYPQDKIKEINTALAAIKAMNDSYDKTVADADNLFDGKKYSESIAGYNQALGIKPGEKYPAERITEAQKIIADLKAQQESYAKAITEGDKQFSAKAYTEALSAYNNAKTILPDEKYPVQKIAEINIILNGIKAIDDQYNTAISNADGFFGQKKYREALEPYESASTIKPAETYPKQQIDKINQLLAEQKKLDDDYAKLVAEADKAFNEKRYQPALSSYRGALELKSFEQYPKDKINTINGLLAEIQARDELYNKALAEGDAHFASNDLQSSLGSYQSALAIKPGETYPAEKIATIEAKLKEIDNQYNKLLAEGDSRLSVKEYTQALNAYQQAGETKPKEQYPKDKIAEINKALAMEKEQLESMYAGFVADGDRLLAGKSYIEARSAFNKASGLKPTEQYPRDKLNEISNILAERSKAMKDEYDKSIVLADNYYQQKVLDQAIEAYEKAASIKPDETYPGEMIRKIKQYITDHAIKEVNKSAVTIASGDERKFTFAVIEPRLRKNNYILIHARATSGTTPKVFLNYGRDAQKNGGIVLRTIAPGEGADYLIRLAGQDRWYREDNNWISIYTEGSDVEISKIQISSGDE